MAKSKAATKSKVTKKAAASRGPAQEALQVTWLLKGHLKNIQIAYLRVGILLARVRDEKLYEALKHPDMEDYAEQRLSLGRSSLYRYLRIRDWVAGHHKEWLEPKPKGFIPDLSDIADLMWIENELAARKIAPARKAGLEALKTKALNGELRQGDLAQWRQQRQKGRDTLKTFASKLQGLRTQGSRLADMPPEVLSHLDVAVGILKNGRALAACGIDFASLERNSARA